MEGIDILMPTYNGEKYVKEQIESILNQTHKKIRLLISDDCSKDNTVEVIKELQKKDDRIVIFEQKNNLGVVKNIEFLLNKVENDLYMLTDQDDVWLENKVEETLKTLKRDNADLVFGDLEIVDGNLNTIYPSFVKYSKLDKKIKKYINTYKLNYLYNCITGCTIMSKKVFIKDILPFPAVSKYSIHDHWIGLIVSLKGKLTFMPEKYIKYRQHGDNEVGTRKLSHTMKKISDIRKLFIDVKLGIFRSYVTYNDKFPEKLQKLNLEALKYFEMLEKKKHMNWKKWTTFHKLYKTENFIYYIENFIILNMPFIGNALFKVRYGILKLMKKR